MNLIITEAFFLNSNNFMKSSFFARGTLHVQVGPMFSGKTTWLNNELTRYADKGFRVCKIVPLCDIRDDVSNTSSSSTGTTHNSSPGCLSSRITVIPINSKDSLALQSVNVLNYDVIGIDEGQFYSNLRKCIEYWVDNLCKQVRVAGLDGDFNRQSFGEIPLLLPIADVFSKITATCTQCLQECSMFPSIDTSFFNAPFTHKLDTESTSEQIDIGGSNKYVPLCRNHYNASHI